MWVHATESYPNDSAEWLLYEKLAATSVVSENIDSYMRRKLNLLSLHAAFLEGEPKWDHLFSGEKHLNAPKSAPSFSYLYVFKPLLVQ